MDEPMNKHSMAHKRWRREQDSKVPAHVGGLTDVMDPPEEEIEGDVLPGGGDPDLKGFDPPEEELGTFAKIKKVFSSDK